MPKNGWIIPDDWINGEYQLYFMCVPDSPEWIATVEGAVYELTRGRNWDETTGTITDAQAIGKEVFFSMTNANEGLMAIANAITQLANSQQTGGFDCGCPGGTGVEYDQASESEPSVFGPGETWATEQAYLDAKCTMANLMWQDYKALLVKLDDLDVDTLTSGAASLGVGLVAGAFLALFATGPIVLTIGAVTGIVALMAGATLFSLSDMVSAMDTNKDDLICELYNATDAAAAKSGFETVLDGAGLSSVELALVSLLGVTSFYNQLFVLPQGYDQQTIDNPIDCTGCFDGVTVRYGSAIDGVTDRGSGDLTPDGSSRTISSFQDSNGFHYIEFALHLPATPRPSYFNTCNEPPLPAGLCAGGNSTFRLRRTANTRLVDSGTRGSSCVACQFSEEFNSDASLGTGIDHDVIWFQAISTTAFTMDFEIAYTPS